MTFKEQLEATVQEGRDYNAITAEVKEILLAAAKSGESNVFLPLTDEHVSAEFRVINKQNN